METRKRKIVSVIFHKNAQTPFTKILIYGSIKNVLHKSPYMIEFLSVCSMRVHLMRFPTCIQKKGAVHILFLTVILLLAIVEDIKTDKVSNLFQLAAFCSGLLYGFYFFGLDEMKKHMILLLILFMLGQLLFWTRALGAGDIKLWMCSSLFMPCEDVFPYMVGAMVLAVILGYGKKVIHLGYYPGRIHFTVPMFGSCLWLICSRL